MKNCRIKPESQFARGFECIATTSSPLIVLAPNLFWESTGNPILEHFVFASGPSAGFETLSSKIYTTLSLPGNGFTAENGAYIGLGNVEMGGFEKAVHSPNIGTGNYVVVEGCFILNCTEDVVIQNPNTTGLLNGIFSWEKSYIEPSITNIAVSVRDPDPSKGFYSVGDQNTGGTTATITNITPQTEKGGNTGALDGGILTRAGGLSIDVQTGNGYISDPVLKYITWNDTTVTLPAHSVQFIYVNENGTVQTATPQPDAYSTIILGKAETNNINVVYVQDIKNDAFHTASQLDNSWRQGLGPIYASGSITSRNDVSNVQLDVSSGRYYYGTHEYRPSGGTAIEWCAFYRSITPGQWTIAAQTSIDYNHYDDGSGTLATIPTGKFARHALYIVNDGIEERYLLQYAQLTYNTLIDAQNGVIPPQPGNWSGNIALISSIIVENTAIVTNQIAEVRDERPTLAFKASGVSVVTNHGNLTGLLNDDHPQYLLTNGGRTVTGSLDMGGNSITNVNLVDGVDVPAHASRHLPSGADPLTTALPVNIGSTNQIGIQNSLARSDHIHAHGDQAGGSLHADATTTTAGFMSETDKTKLDNINTGDFVQKSGDTMTGTLAINAAGSNALTVNTNKLVVDSDTGNTSIGGTLNVAGQTTLSDLTTGVVHSSASGILSSSLIIDADTDPTANFVVGAQAANNATSANIADSIVKRDASGNFTAGTITATLIGSATSATSATNFTGALSGDVTGTQSATTVAAVGGKSATEISTSVNDTQTATATNLSNTLVKRDILGNFSANTITANLIGNATTATSTTNFSGTLAGDVTGTQGATIVANVGSKTAAEVSTSVNDTQAATASNLPNTLVKRDASGNFQAGTITANVTGSASNNVLKTGDTITGALTLSGTTADLTVGGSTNIQDLLVQTTSYFTQGVPGIQAQTIQVTKGTLSGPNQFNSIKSAIDSITDASITKPYTVSVGPGVYTENTITLKPWVTLCASSAATTFVVANDPTQTILIGAPDACVSKLTFDGASGSTGKAVYYEGGGDGHVFIINQCAFGSNETQVSIESTTLPMANIIINNSPLMGDFVHGYTIDGNSGIPILCYIASTLWQVETAASLNTMLSITGTNAQAHISSSKFYTISPTTGNGFVVQNGAHLGLNGVDITGFNKAIHAPNTGSGPYIHIEATFVSQCTQDLSIENPSTEIVAEATIDWENSTIDPSVQVSAELLSPDPSGGIVVVGPQYVGATTGTITNISPQIEQGGPLGVIDGGALSRAGGFDIDIQAGTGYISNPTLTYVTWSGTTKTIPSNTAQFIYVDSDGTVQLSTSAPQEDIDILLGKAQANGTGIVYVQDIQKDAHHTASQLDRSWRQGLGSIYASGSLVSKNGSTQLDVSSGRYYFSTHEFTPSGGTPITWYAFYRNSIAGQWDIVSQNNIDYNHYDNGSGTLATLPTNNFARHALYIVNDGAEETYLLQYGQTVYTSLIDAQNGTIPPQPGNWNGNITLIASIIAENTAIAADQIAEIRDERPTLSFKASGVSAVSNHGDLSGLLADDHPQYVLVDGSRAMTGSLDMGGTNITNVNLVDGVDVPAHAARHLPNGADPLTTDAPVNIGTSNQEGIANAFARSDHVHNHGNLIGGTLHDVATITTAGFMSAADKVTLNSINPSNFVAITGDTMTGPLALNASGSNALVINTDKFIVNNDTGSTTIGGTIEVAGQTTLSNLSTGVVHSNATGILSSSLIVNADIDPAAAIVDTKLATISSAGKVANTATTATSTNAPNTIVLRDSSGNFSAGTITANLLGNATNFTGTLAGDVTGIQGSTVVASAGGKTAAEIATSVNDTQAATATNTPNTLVKRDASGNFSASTITANLTGTATNATTAVNFTGTLAGNVSGTQSATVVDSVGGKTATEIASSVNDTQAATAINLPNTIVKRDGSGNFAAGTITANVSGTLTGNVIGNVTGSASNNVLKAGDTMTGALTMDNQQEIQLRELSTNGTDHVAMKAPASLATSYTLTWPDNDGAANQVLSTDGTGTLSWITPSGGGAPTTNAKMMAYASASLTLPANTTVTVPFDTEVFDPNNNYNPTTYTYTAPTTGFYLVCSQFSFSANSSYATRRLNVLVNGTPKAGSQLSFTEPSIPATIATLELLTAGDTLSIEYTGRNGDTIQANGANLSIHLLSL